jgi:glycosyltransferase involved in cell wall biosynthesis
MSARPQILYHPTVRGVSDAPRHRSVLVANLAAPEINRLTIELERRGVLRYYVRPYLNQGRLWERLIGATPLVGRLYRRTLGRRTPPADMPLRRIVEAGVAEDILGAMIARLPYLNNDWRRAWAQQLVFRTERAVAMRAGSLSRDVQVVVASYGTGRHAFEAVRRAGGRAVLSYPIAHNDFQAKLYAEEAQLKPQFAAALPRLGQLPSEYTERLEAECELADLILVGSTFVQQSFVALGFDARKIAVTPYGVDTARFVPRASPRRDRMFRVLFVGQIGQRKGVSYLFEAFRLFRRADTELHVVGSYVSGHQVYRRYANLYRHTPHVPQKDLPALYHEADAFVLPSLAEGMPLVVLEAMACGIPVITTTNGAADIVRDGVDGFLVPIRDPEAIALRLEQLYGDPALRERLGRNARQQALRHTWEVYARRAADAVEATVRWR